MITVLSLNTAMDRIQVVPGFHANGVFRTQSLHLVAGGKGLNVARVVRQLGQPVRVIGFLGGMSAPEIRRQCDDLGMQQHWVEIAGHTRTCVIVVDPQTGEQTVLNEDGPTVTDREIDSLWRQTESSVKGTDVLCISGSAPPGVPETFCARAIHALKSAGARTLVDVSGRPLRLAWEAAPWAIAPNLAEFEGAFDSGATPEAAARKLASRSEHALLTLGSAGVLYAHGGAAKRFSAPRIGAVSAVGSGDALVAGFVAGIEEGLAVPEAVALGMACGASNAEHIMPGISSRDEVERLAGSVQSRWDAHGPE
ncbi:MAG: 1-phosphofructokinase family hexose kinase [Chloroflexota bacterium]